MRCTSLKLLAAAPLCSWPALGFGQQALSQLEAASRAPGLRWSDGGAVKGDSASAPAQPKAAETPRLSPPKPSSAPPVFPTAYEEPKRCPAAQGFFEGFGLIEAPTAQALENPVVGPFIAVPLCAVLFFPALIAGGIGALIGALKGPEKATAKR